jgi:high-affinity K+ transport system ATPase subunit B
MLRTQVSVSPLLDAAMWDLEIQGKTAVCVAVDGTIRGVLGLADTAKAEAFSTIKALRAMGLDVWMVSLPAGFEGVLLFVIAVKLACLLMFPLLPWPKYCF